MYKRRYLKNGLLSRRSCFLEWKALHDVTHHYLCTNHPDANRYSNQEKAISVVLMDYNLHCFDKLLREYIKEYPQVF